MRKKHQWKEFLFVVDAVFSYLKVFGNLQKICRGKNTFTDMLMRIFIEISSYNRYFSSRCQLMYAFSDSLSYLVIISYCLAREIAPPPHEQIIMSSTHSYFSFLLIFLYFLKLVSLKICAMWVCKLFLHQNGWKGRIWF